MTPESTDDSRRLRVVSDLPHGRLFARSANVSRLDSCSLRFRAAEPPQSLMISVNWAKELRRRRLGGGDVSCTSVGGDMVVI